MRECVCGMITLRETQEREWGGMYTSVRGEDRTESCSGIQIQDSGG